MKPLFVLFSLLFASSVAFSQVAPPEQHQPQQGEQGWVQIPVGSSSAWLRSVTTTPSGIVWIGGPDLVSRSLNTGSDWAAVETPVKGTIKFYDDSIGVLAGGAKSVFTTTNGGNTWIPGNFTELNQLYDLTFATAHNVYAVGLGGVSKSTDGGKTWFKRSVNTNTALCIRFADSLYGYIGGSYPSGAPFGLMFRTSDAGESWETVHTPPYEWQGVYATSRDTLFLASLDGYIFKSTDRGSNWKQVLFTEKGWGIQAIHFINSREGFAAGGRNKIYYTSDGGESWVLQSVPSKSLIYCFSFIGDTIGFASGEDGVLLKTLTKGKSFVALPETRDLQIHISPEPVRGIARLTYTLDIPQHVTLSIYGADGTLRTTLLNGTQQSSGPQSILLDASQWSSGVYLYMLESERYSASGRITVIH